MVGFSAYKVTNQYNEFLVAKQFRRSAPNLGVNETGTETGGKKAKSGIVNQFRLL